MINTVMRCMPVCTTVFHCYNVAVITRPQNIFQMQSRGLVITATISFNTICIRLVRITIIWRDKTLF